MYSLIARSGDSIMADRADDGIRSDSSPPADLERKVSPNRADVDAPERDVGRSRREDDADDQDSEDGSDGGGDQSKQTRWPLIALLILVVIATIGVTIYWFATKDQETTDDAYTDGRAVVVAPHVSGYVKQLAINDNQFVHQGDFLVEIERMDYVAARDQAAGQLAAMDAQLTNARVALDKARIIYPAQLAQAQGQLEQAHGQLFQAEREYRRQHNVDRAATSQQSVDTATANFHIAQGQVEQATAQVRQMELVDQNIAQAEAQVKQLEGQVQQAQANLNQAEINLGYTGIIAPRDGWITKRNVEIGNYLQAGAEIFAIVAPEVWVTANFKETQLARMRPEQRVRIRVDAYPQLRLDGHVDSIQFGSGTKFTAFPPENATGNFVKIVQRVPVKIMIDRGLDPNVPLPLGVSVEPTVLFK
jgi:membrane fusion protein (multidrug efflux system)